MRPVSSFSDLDILDGGLHYDLQIEARPLFRESFFLVVPLDLELPDTVHPFMLHVEDEILVSGQPEILQWHDCWFGMDARPLLYTDIPQLAETLPSCGRRWVICPAAAAAHSVRQFGTIRSLRLEEAPADRTFYLVTPKGRALSDASEQLLADLQTHLRTVDGIHLFE